MATATNKSENNSANKSNTATTILARNHGKEIKSAVPRERYEELLNLKFGSFQFKKFKFQFVWILQRKAFKMEWMGL